MAENAGHEALHQIDRILASKPEQNGDAFTAATQALCTLRNEVIRRRDTSPTPGLRQSLDHLNAVISIVLGGHYPLGPVPWAEIKTAKGWLEDIVASIPAAR